MQHITKSNTTSSSPSGNGLLRQFRMEIEPGVYRSVVLRYHVWKQGGVPRDGYEVIGTAKSASFNQVQQAVRLGVLEPVDDDTRRIFQRPSQLAEALAAA